MTQIYYQVDETLFPELAAVKNQGSIVGGWSSRSDAQFAVITNYTQDNLWKVVSLHKTEKIAKKQLEEYVLEIQKLNRQYLTSSHLSNSQYWLGIYNAGFKAAIVPVVKESAFTTV